ncbi:hypothetical protein LTR37_015580 [Vermiconidia calcicola]|uniref:Uncharacterized protein n=1 Tax=Vermiconidia calcicola TaxID=1690605 RepID=A0ACC3MRU6_9PEZI|nr:hypothetical protein LTR37_015580 [Vermiconidia calcicola]
MAGAKRSSKRQARLAFSPLPSSSPAAKGYNKQIQERAAAVSLDALSSSAKRRKLRDNGLEMNQMDGVNDSIPTPAASLEQGLRSDDESESEPVRSIQRKSSTQQSSKRKARQQRIDFSTTREPSSFSPGVKLSSPSRPQASSRASMFSTQRRQRPVVDVSSGDSDDRSPSPRKRIDGPKSKSKRSDARAKANGSGARITRASQKAILVDSESDEDNIVVGSGSPRVVKVESDEEDDDIPAAMGTQRRKRTRRASPDSFIDSSPPRAIDRDSDVEIIEKPQKSAKRRRQDDSEEEDEDEDEDVPITPGRRRLKRPRQLSQRERDDLDDDVEDLQQSSDVEPSARTPRNTQTAQKTARKSALDQLRLKRSGFQPTQPEQEEEEEPDEYGSDEEEEDYPKPMSSSQMFNENDDDAAFLEDDEEEEDPLGVPDGVPIEFTRFASMKPKELFKHAVEWMIQKKINPAFNKDDSLYRLTFQKLDDEATGLTASKFVSSVWTADFKIALESRPEIAYESIDRNSAEHYLRDHCDACNRTNHPCTYQIQFLGKPYQRNTLEEVAGNDDDDDDDSSSEDAADQPAWNAQDQQVVPENKIFYVGKFCMSNAQTSHALRHWRYHLNEFVVDWLTRRGYNTTEKIVERDQLSTKKRGRLANKIVDRMEEEKVVKQLWQDFRRNIDEARDSKQGRW